MVAGPALGPTQAGGRHLSPEVLGVLAAVEEVGAGVLQPVVARLQADPTRSRHPQPEVAVTPGSPELHTGGGVLDVQLPADRRVLEQQRGRLDQDRLAVAEVADEGVAAALDQHQPGLLAGGEAVDVAAHRVEVTRSRWRRSSRRAGIEAGQVETHLEQPGPAALAGAPVAGGAEPDAAVVPVVADAQGGRHQLVLPDVDRRAGLQGHGHDLAGGVVREGDRPGAGRLAA